MPHIAVMEEKMAAALQVYAEAGGRVVLGARTGYKDRYGRCRMTPMPGPAAGLAGVRVREYSLPRPDESAKLSWNGASYPVTGFQESLEAAGSNAAGSYDSGWLAGEAGLTVKAYPDGGKVWYMGTGFTEELAGAFLREAGVWSPYAGKIDCPPEVELAVHVKGKTAWYYALNDTRDENTLKLGTALVPLIGGTVLPPCGVSVFREERE